MTSGCLCRIALAVGLVAGAAPLSAETYVDPLDLTAAGFAALVKTDAVKWERIVRDTGARAD